MTLSWPTDAMRILGVDGVPLAESPRAEARGVQDVAHHLGRVLRELGEHLRGLLESRTAYG
jgi:hypothetical protein